jgi:hypothetical protein
MWTILRSIILAAILAPAMLLVPPLPAMQGTGETQAFAPAISRLAANGSCSHAGWPYNAQCVSEGASAARVISVDRIVR